MSAKTITHGLKIYLRASVSQNTTIGLYTANGASQFRWIENAVVGTADTWKTGMLAAGGLPAIKESADLTRCGNTAILNSIEVSVKNTSQFYKTIHLAGISINGLRCEIVEFEKNLGTGVVTETVVYRGKINTDKWSESNYVIPIEPADAGRRSQLGTVIDTTAYQNASADLVGKLVPMTFGKFDIDGQYAKFVRTADAETTFELSATQEFNDGIVALFLFWHGVNAFPIIGDDGDNPPIMYKITLGSSPGWYQDGVQKVSGVFDLTDYFAGMYVQAIEGTGSGTYRRIESAQVDLDANPTAIEITLTDYFSEKLIGNITATAQNQTWVKIIDIAREYEGDVWPCRSFLDTDANEIAQGLNLFSYASSKKAKVTTENVDALIEELPMQFFRLPSYAYKIPTGDADKNRIDIDVGLFDSNPDQMKSYLILPPSDIQLMTDNPLLDWWGLDYSYIEPGVYNTSITPPGQVVTGVIANMVDKKVATSYKISAQSGMYAFRITLPAFPKNFEFDRMFAGHRVHAAVQDNSQAYSSVSLTVRWRRFIGAQRNVVEWQVASGNNKYGKFENIPDFYYLSGFAPSSKNKLFYHNGSNFLDVDGYYTYSGLNALEFSGIGTEEAYKSIDDVGLFVWIDPFSATVDLNLYEIALIFEKSVSISGAIYTPFSGRTYNDTWGARKTAANVIESPVDIFEHVCRLQNWSEAGDTTTNFGKAYSASALINATNGDGGFDSARLDDVKNRRFAFQVFDEANSWSDVMKRDLCRAAWLANYVNEYGQECVEYLLKTDLAPEDIITLGDDPQNPLPDTLDADTITPADTPDGLDLGTVVEPAPANIFCEPFVRFRYNAATEKFDRMIAITQVHQATWNATYTPGLDATNGEALWQRCHDELWAVSHAIEQPPSDMTDQYMISRNDDAVWFLHNWISWMTRRRITVQVYFEKARRWHIGRHVYLQLPHQTDNAIIECVVESIEKNARAGYCSIGLIMLDGVTSHAITSVQDTMLAMAEGADAEWIDTTADQGAAGNKIDGMMV